MSAIHLHGGRFAGPHRHGELHLCEGKPRFYVVRLKQTNKWSAGVCFVLDHLNNVVCGAFFKAPLSLIAILRVINGF